MAQPIVNPEIPFVGEVSGGLQPGKLIRIQGVTHPNSDRFNVNLATGPNNKPRDDTALHVSVRLNQGYIARNSYRNQAWDKEEGKGKLPIGPAQSFEILLLVDPDHFKIAVNGQHFSEFKHRLPFESITHLLIDGDVSITLISFEGIVLGGGNYGPPPQGGYGPPPQGGYGPPPQGNYGPPPNYGGYGPPPPPGAEPQSEFGGFLEQAQDILAGAIKSGAAEKLLGSILHPSGAEQPQQQAGYAHQNARYGLYPSLPTQENSNVQAASNAQDSTLSNLIAESGGTITSGSQIPPAGPPLPPQGPGNPPPPGVGGEAQNQPGPVESMLLNLLGGGGGQSGGGATGATQSGGSELISGLLSSLLSGNSQNQPTGGQAPPVSQQQQQQGGGSEVLTGILQSLLNSNDKQQQSQNPPPPTNQQGQGATSDVLAGILSNLLASNQNQQGPNASPPQYNAQVPPPSQNQTGNNDALSGILQSLISGGGQSGPAGQNLPPPPLNQQQSNQNPSSNNTELLTNLLQGLLSKAGDQHNMTRPIQENPAYGGPGGPPDPAAVPQGPPQQYGQYPHPPQQEQKGPVESLLSGLLSGGGGAQPQQPQGPQLGGGPSVGGLGSMGGLLGSLAGSLFQRQDQRH
ncbi:hypothetical protein GWI33_019962 [Rhynchophorus ferrugineus]|uniref:Galectin domain-containing protein n=1 Tax=Rhynchophorus ferrugineus TaxID=354439 RepID=A0A834LZY8_RHYFE|nr:hypothetical protein GWI33_019962 [Rhynchophorus ferrugineus]